MGISFVGLYRIGEQFGQLGVISTNMMNTSRAVILLHT